MYKYPETEREYRRKLYLRHEEQGLCRHCARKALPGLTRCIYCDEIARLQGKRYRKDKKLILIRKDKEMRQEWRQENRCIRCGAPLQEGKYTFRNPLTTPTIILPLPSVSLPNIFTLF